MHYLALDMFFQTKTVIHVMNVATMESMIFVPQPFLYWCMQLVGHLRLSGHLGSTSILNKRIKLNVASEIASSTSQALGLVLSLLVLPASFLVNLDTFDHSWHPYSLCFWAHKINSRGAFDQENKTRRATASPWRQLMPLFCQPHLFVKSLC